MFAAIKEEKSQISDQSRSVSLSLKSINEDTAGGIGLDITSTRRSLSTVCITTYFPSSASVTYYKIIETLLSIVLVVEILCVSSSQTKYTTGNPDVDPLGVDFSTAI
jgi:hypothetical protein